MVRVTLDGLDIPGIGDLRPVAHGGFGVVHRGHQPAFNRDVAVKVVTTGGIDEAVRRRFERECQALGVLSDHPNIVSVHAAGSLATGEPYMVMPFLESGSYQDHIDTSGPMHWRDAVDAIIKIANALEVAHQQGIVHCDVKPANILRSRFGEQELSDFGIARLAAAGASTSAQSFTPNFVAPEVFNDVEPEPSRDIYALGATFIALVTGEPPFRSTTGEILALIAAVASQPPPDLRPLGVPDAVCRVIEATMAKAPHERPQSAATLASPVVDAQVARTSGAGGNGDCFLSLRRSPTSTSAEVARLDEGDPISLVCQTRGESVKSSLLGSSTDIWSRTVSGLFVSSAFLDGPNVDPFTITLPPCA